MKMKRKILQVVIVMLLIAISITGCKVEKDVSVFPDGSSQIECQHKFIENQPFVIFQGETPSGYAVQRKCNLCGLTTQVTLSDDDVAKYGLPSLEELLKTSKHTHSWVTTQKEATAEEYEAFTQRMGTPDETPLRAGYASRYVKTTKACECGETQEAVQRIDEPICRAGHTYGDWVITKAPTCTSAGKQTRTCEKCGVVTEQNVAALAHTFGDWKVTTAATCGKAGVESRACPNCGRIETRSIAALTHSYGSWVTTKAATCTAQGVQTRTCKNCGNVETQNIAQLSHTYGSWVTTKAATCTAQGVQTRTCKNCGNVETQNIAQLSHTYGSWSTTKAATCTETGTQTRKCTKCGKAETKSIAATGHTYGDWRVTKPATCASTGTNTRTCTKCGIVDIKQIAKSTTHTWNSGVVSGSTKTYTCTVCGTTKTEKVTACSHTWGSYQWDTTTRQEKLPGLPAYTITERTKYQVCTKCGEKKTVVAQHKCNGLDDTATKATCVSKGHHKVTCTICGYVSKDEELPINPDNHAHTLTHREYLCDATENYDALYCLITTCQDCGNVRYVFSKVEDKSWVSKCRFSFGVSPKATSYGTGFAYAEQPEFFYKNPTWQYCVRNVKYDSEGYVYQLTYIWVDAKTGVRYSEVVDVSDKKAFVYKYFPKNFADANYDRGGTWTLEPRGDHLVGANFTYSG